MDARSIVNVLFIGVVAPSGILLTILFGCVLALPFVLILRATRDRQVIVF